MSMQRPKIREFAAVAGKSYVIVTVVPAGAPHPFVRLPDGSTKLLHPIPIAELVQTLGGYQGQITDPLAGQQLSIDLTSWAGEDPQQTRVVLMWGFAPLQPVALQHRHLFDSFDLTHDTYSKIVNPVTIKVWDGSKPFELFT